MVPNFSTMNHNDRVAVLGAAADARDDAVFARDMIVQRIAVLDQQLAAANDDVARTSSRFTRLVHLAKGTPVDQSRMDEPRPNPDKGGPIMANLDEPE